MYVHPVSLSGYGGSWKWMIPVPSPFEGEPEYGSLLDEPDKGEDRKYRNVTHVKGKGEFYLFPQEVWDEWRADARVRLAVACSPVKLNDGDRHWQMDPRSSYLPEVPYAYDERIKGCRPTSVMIQSWRGERLVSRYGTVYWVGLDGLLKLTATWSQDPNTGDIRTRFGTSVTLTSVPAKQIKLLGGLLRQTFDVAWVPYEVETAFGNMVPSVIDQMHAVDMNQFEFISNPNLVKDVIQLGKSIANADGITTLKEAAEVASDVYLSYRFGATSTARDYRDLASAISKETTRVYQARKYRDRRVRSRTFFSVPWLFNLSWDVSCNLTAYLDNFDQGIMGMMNKLDSWGLYPDRAAVWEIVPFSFVVDWFVNVQENLERRDAQYWREFYNCRACICTRKLSTCANASVMFPNSLIGGSADISLYNRRVQRSLPVPAIDLDIGLPKGKHAWITSAALVIQRSG